MKLHVVYMNFHIICMDFHIICMDFHIICMDFHIKNATRDPRSIFYIDFHINYMKKKLIFII